MVALFIILPFIIMIASGVWIYFSLIRLKDKITVPQGVEEYDWRSQQNIKRTKEVTKTINNKNKLIQLIVGVFIATIGLFVIIFVPGSFHQVGAGEVAVVKIWGDAREVRSAGMHFDLWINHKYEIYDCKVQQIPITTSAYSSDSQPMDIQLYVQYQIQQENAMLIAKNYGGLEMLESRISTVSTEKMKSVLSKYKAEELIQKRGTISPEVEESVRSAIKSDYYSNIVTVVLTNIDFSDAFEKSVEDKMIAEQEKLKAQYENEKLLEKAKNELEIAKQQAEAKLVAAQGDANAQKAIADAEAYSTSIKIVELARTMGYSVTTKYSEDDETIIGYDIDWKTSEYSPEVVLDHKNQILAHLEYLEYLSKWDGKLPEVVSGDNTSIMFPIN